jgi:hypothetical protein
MSVPATDAARCGLGGVQADAGLQRRVALDRDPAVGQRCILGGNAVELPDELDVQILGKPLVLVDELFPRRAEGQPLRTPRCARVENPPDFQRILPQQEIVDLFGADDQLERVDCLIPLAILQRQIEHRIAVQRDGEIRLGGLDRLVVQHLDAVVVREVDQQQMQRLLRPIVGLQRAADDFPFAVFFDDVDGDVAAGILMQFAIVVVAEQFAKFELHVVGVHLGRSILQGHGSLPGGDLLEDREHVVSGLLRIAPDTLDQLARVAQSEQVAVVLGAQRVASSFRRVGQQGNAQRAVVRRGQELLKQLDAARVAFEKHGQRRHGQTDDFGLIAGGWIGVDVQQFQVALLSPDLHRCGVSGQLGPIRFRVEGQFHRLVGIAGQTVQRAAVHSPAVVAK